MDGVRIDRATADSQIKEETTFGSKSGDGTSKSESVAEVSSPFRRSQRKRTTTRRYSSHDFRPVYVSDEEDILETSSNRKMRKGRDKVEKWVSFKSPPYSPPNCHELEEGSDISGEQSVEFLSKQKELEQLRTSSIHALRESREVSRQKLVEEKARLRDKARKKREEEKQKILEEKAKLKEEKKLKKLATQEKLKLARNLLREAQKDSRKRQKEREKVRKQQELHLLKEKRQSEKRRKQELTSAPILRANNEVTMSPRVHMMDVCMCVYLCVCVCMFVVGNLWST